MLALIQRIVSLALQILGLAEQILGLERTAAQETSRLAIQTIAANGTNEILNPFHGVAAVKTDLDAVRTGSNLTLQSVIDAMPEGGMTELPETPPEGYGGSTPAQVWQHTQAAWFWQSPPDSYEMQQHLKDVRAWTEAQFPGLGVVWPDCPDFAYCVYGGFNLQTELSVDGDLHDAKPTGVDWTAWNGTETLVAFLNRVKPALTWSYTSIFGVTTPGWAWGYDTTNNPAGHWRCLVSDADLPVKSARIGGVQTELANQQALTIAIGLASLFALGAGDVASLVAQVTALLASSDDIEGAITSLLDWLSGRSQVTNQAQSTQLATVADYTDTLETALATDTSTITGDIAQAVLDLAADILAARGTGDPTIADVRSDLTTIRGDSVTTLASLDAKLDDILDALASASGGAPSWPGLANVTLGDAIPITEDMSIEGPIDGAVYHITAAPGRLAKSVLGGHTSWLRLGNAAFISDRGDMDAFQSVNWDYGMLLPRFLLTPDSLVLHFEGGVTGTVTPWIRAIP
jgi:hypothetical protein